MATQKRTYKKRATKPTEVEEIKLPEPTIDLSPKTLDVKPICPYNAEEIRSMGVLQLHALIKSLDGEPRAKCERYLDAFNRQVIQNGIIEALGL